MRQSDLRRRSSRRRLACALSATALGALMALGGPTGPAAADAGLRAAVPGPRDLVGDAPVEVQLQFGVPTVADDRTRLSVIGPDGHELGQGAVDASALGVVRHLLPAHVAGVYTVAFTVASVDGRLSSGSYTFTFAPSGSSDGGTGATLALTGLAALGVSGLVGVQLLHRRRRRALGPAA